MADGTVRGTFDLNAEPAKGKLRALRTDAKQTDEAFGRLGTRMESTAGKTAAAWESSRKSFDTQTDRMEARLTVLEKRLERFGHIRAAARVELQGVERANAQITLLEHRLNSLSRERSTPTIAGGGLGGGGFSSATSSAGGGGGGFGMGGKLALGAGLLLPALQALPVSATALLGSASGAALGAGAVGIGGVGTLGVGAGLTAAVAKPAVKELQALEKAQLKYNETVRKYGEASKQAAVGRRELAHSEQMVGPGAGVAARQISLARTAWRGATAPGRQAIYGAIGNAAVAFRGAAPNFGRAANISAGATAGAATNFAGFLGGGQTQTTTLALAKEFARDMPIAERSLQNVTSTVEHLSMAARPFFHEAMMWTESWTHGLASNSSNEARVTQTMSKLVAETKDWGRLGGAAFRTIKDIFNMGRPSGDSMVVNLTDTLDRWDSWIQRNPQKVSSFFKEAQHTTEGVASALTGIVHLLSQAATQLTPIFNRATGLVSIVSALGPGTTTLGSAALYGGYAAFRGSRGGGGPSAGGLLRTGLLGSPLRSGGASGGVRAPGGGVFASAPGSRAMLGEGVYNVRPSQVATRAPGGGFIVGPGVARAAPSDIFGAANAARDTGPFLSIASRSRGLGGLGSRIAQSRVGGALGGAAKTVGATVAIMAALEAAGKGGSVGDITQNFASSATLGLIHPIDNTGARGASWATRFAGGIPSTLSPAEQQAVLGRKIARDLSHSFSERKGLGEANFGEFLGKNRYNTFGGARLNPNAPGFMAQVGSQLKALEGTGGGHAANVTQEIKALRTAWQEAKASADAYKKSRNEALNLQSEAHATQITSHLGAAFGVETKGGRSTAGAFGDVTHSTLGALRSMRDPGRKVLAENTLAWAKQLEKAHPELKRPVDELTDDIKDRFKKLGKDVEIVNGHILTGSAEDWSRISTAMSDPIEKAREKMSKAFTAIQREAVSALVLMGFNKKGAEAVISGQEKGGKSAGQITSGAVSSAASTAGKIGKGLAHGGMISGKGLTDSVQVPGGMAAPGEGWIANRHTLNDISRATVKEYGYTAQQMISNEHRRHSMPGYAMGGALGGVRSGVANVAGAMLKQFPGLSVTSTTSGTHATNSLHYLGEAVDLAGGASTMLAAAGWTGRTYGRSLEEGIHDPNLSIKHGANVPSSFWGEPTWADHANHIHVGVLGGGGAAGAAAGATATAQGRAQAIHLKNRTSGMGGIPGLLANAGISKYGHALQSRVNARLAAKAGAGGANFAGVGGHGGAPGANESLGKEMMLAAGWGAQEWPSLKALWTQESGWDANSVNSSSGAYGIPQALGHGHPFNLGDARAQIAWGLNYIKGRYGSPGAAESHERSNNWYSRGGRTPAWGGWNAAGGSFTTNGPTVFGAGEGHRREKVSITPLGKGSGPGGHNVTVNIAHVSLNNGTKADVKRVAKEVAAEILNELDNTDDGTSDRELIGR